MIKIQFLGTCAGLPSKQRNVSSLIVQMLSYQDECWMFDCGEATQQQLLYSSISPRKINKIFISHLHGDHIFGLPGLLSSRSFQGAANKLEVYGPKGIKQFIETALAISNTYVKYPLEIIELTEGTLCVSENFSFEAVKLEHGISSFGFRIVEKDLPGELRVDELVQLGIRPGPIYKQLKMGKEVALENGHVIDGRKYLGPNKKGKVIAVCGDTRDCDASRRVAHKADVLVHEATFLHKDKELAFEHYHSTTYQAAQLAKEAGVNALFLNHISARYCQDPNQLLTEARDVFLNTFLPDDLQTYIIKQNNQVMTLSE